MSEFADELQQFQSTFNAAIVDDKPSGDKPKKAWTPPFKVGEREEAIISECYCTRPPWEGDDGVYLRVELTHPMNDGCVDIYLPLTAKSIKQAEHVKRTLKNMGYDLDDGVSTLAGIEDHAESFVGNRVEIYTQQSEYNGKTRYNYYINKTVRLVTPGGSMIDDIPF